MKAQPMTGRLFGLETEFAFSALWNGEKSRDSDGVLARFDRHAAARLPHLRASSGGNFLTNGSRLYQDGGHEELAGPECTNPGEAVRFILAGERILANLAADFRRSVAGIADATFFKTNVDYGTKATWGTHENFLVEGSVNKFQRDLVPHLVSRLLHSGSGGFNPCSPGLAFTLSPRAWRVTSVASPSSTDERPIFHTKDEPLCASGYRRVHIICGESLCSETAMYLRTGTTALVLALSAAGCNPGRDVQLIDPLHALHCIAADPACTAEVRTIFGGKTTALGIQRH